MEAINEAWADIRGHEGVYKVSSLGRVINIKRNKIKKHEITWAGYSRMSLGVKKRKMLHRIVAESFIENPNNLQYINHKNGIKSDNRVENLEWCTQSENVLHSIYTLNTIPGNTGNTGRKNPLSRECVMIGNNNTLKEFFGANEAGRETGISTSSIIQVCNGKRKTAGGYMWKWK